MKNKRIQPVRWSLWLGAFFLLVQSVPANAGDALLMRKSGNVEIKQRGKTQFRKASAGQELFFGDTVQTLKDAKAQILFTGGNAILIKENTTMRITGTANNIQANIPQGEFLIGLKKRLTRGQSFRVKTPAAVASVRGTLFWGLSDQELNSTYACFQHRIEISAGGTKVMLNPGEKTFIPYGLAPKKTEPANVPLDYMDTFEVDGSIEGFKDMVGKE